MTYEFVEGRRILIQYGSDENRKYMYSHNKFRDRVSTLGIRLFVRIPNKHWPYEFIISTIRAHTHIHTMWWVFYFLFFSFGMVLFGLLFRLYFCVKVIEQNRIWYNIELRVLDIKWINEESTIKHIVDFSQPFFIDIAYTHSYI